MAPPLLWLRCTRLSVYTHPYFIQVAHARVSPLSLFHPFYWSTLKTGLLCLYFLLCVTCNSSEDESHYTSCSEHCFNSFFSLDFSFVVHKYIRNTRKRLRGRYKQWIFVRLHKWNRRMTDTQLAYGTVAFSNKWTVRKIFTIFIRAKLNCLALIWKQHLKKNHVEITAEIWKTATR